MTFFLQTMLKSLARQLVPMALCVLALFVGGQALAQVEPLTGVPGAGVSLSTFNHATTGFIISGAHLRERCESCHVSATFRGTPRDCATCHRPGGLSPGKPNSHIPTSAACDSCHTTNSWNPNTFRHQTNQGVVQGACSTCHYGFAAQGKPLSHPVTDFSCDSCHKTSAWLPAGYSHALATPGACTTCHNGARATGKPVTHIPTTGSCDGCHSTGVSFNPVSVGVASMHANMVGPVAAGNCSTCHNGAYTGVNAQAKPASHVVTSQQCDTCHSGSASKNYSTWATGVYDHTLANPPANGRCSECHNGSTALGQPASHIPNTQPCDACHTSYTAFKPAAMNHASAAGQCNTCHNGNFTFANAQAKTVAHIPTSTQCDTCHVGGFIKWSPATMDHTGMAGKCITCHSGGFISQNAQTKPATHIGTTAQCDTCHRSNTTWATATFNHTAATPAVSGRCSTCHNGSNALGKPVGHVPTGAQCDSCHNNFTAFKPAVMNHSGSAGQCATCHNGSYLFANALNRPVNHIPASTVCDSCHTSGFVAWSPATMNHGGLAGLCDKCHNGSYLAQNAQNKTPTHIPTAGQCDTCHAGSVSRNYTTWATGTYAHEANAVGQCATCHNGVRALGKPTRHIPTAGRCDSCHNNYSAFKPARMDHANTAGQCSTCHNGSYVFANALGRSLNHIPTIASCETCHSGGFNAWSPALMNHTGMAGICSNCHNGAYLVQNAQTRPATHIVDSRQCDTCHKSLITWATAIYDHASASPPATGRCSGCHNGSNGLGKPTNHIPTTAQCDTCHKIFTAFNPAAMNHLATTGPVAAGNCATCHSGAYTFANAQTKTVTHIVTSASCDTCHNSTVTWAGGTYAHGATAAGTCSSCHNGSSALGKPATHIPTTAQCDTCHTNYTAFKPARMNHTALAGQCSTCHSGSYTAVNALAKPAVHVPTGAQCDTCHSNGFFSFMPGTMNHAGTNSPLAAGNCATCHSGTYLAYNAQVKPATHTVTTAQCDTCHKSTTTWATATFDHATASPPATGRCSTCHNGTNALGKPTTHIPTAAQCDTCHNSFITFAPATMSHAATTGPVASGNCAACHSGTYATVNAQAKTASHIVTTQSCDTCHGTIAWKPASFAHSGVAGGTCATCHNGANAMGKPATHLPTSASCDVCHGNYTAFAPTRMNHSATTGPLAANSCSTCHSGTHLAINAQVKPATHLPTSAQCDTCHKSTTTWATASFAHDAASTVNCAACHNGVAALGKPTTHIPSSAQCSTCHTNFIAFRPAAMSHTGTTGPVATGNCSNCHNGSFTAVNALAKPAIHIPTTGQCDSCHKGGYVTWSPAGMDHSGQAACSTCHSGAYVAQNAQTKPATHIATTAQCSTCHSSTTTWATGVFNHATASPAASGRCSTCHNGTNALGKPTNHIPTTAQCDTCHKIFTAFNPATMDHANTTGPTAGANCSTCHSGAYTFANAQAKTVTHIVTTAQCDTCHSSTVTWVGGTYAHGATAAGTCSTCHNGSSALGKPATHIPTTAQCDTCHSSYTAFKPARMNHSGLAGQCSTCHGGSYTAVNALAKPAVHIPTGAQCDTCHSNGFVAFMPGTMNHTGTTSPLAAGNCATCHSGVYLANNAQIKTATHIPTTAQCDSSGCHSSTTTWATASFNHLAASPAVAGRCLTCHNGTNALGKPTSHIPTAAQCDTCHNTFTAFAPATMSHAATTGPIASGNCATCHSGTYATVNAQAKTAGHIVTTQSCDTCHGTVAWKPSTFTHGGVAAGTCATCHNGTSALGKTATHLPTSASCDVCHANYTAFAPARMNHAGSTGPLTANSCSTCHSGTYLAINAQVKPATHLPTSAQCDTCHKSTTTWATATFNHDATTAGICSTCHNGTNALGKPTTHIPTSVQCSTCHSNYIAFRPAAMSHVGATGPVATGNCSSCHNGGYTAVNALAKPAIHIPTTAQCDSCHKGGYLTWSPATMDHSGQTGCATCHSGSYIAQNAQTKPATHIATTAQCSTCHSSTVTWATGIFNHATASPAASGRCSTCHNGSNALGKPTNHIPTTAQCDTCHKNYTAFAPAAMDHANATGPVSAANCATCHSGSYTFANAQAKTATHLVTVQSCDSCHGTVAWKPTTFAHSGVAAGICATCHNNSNALGKPASHLPTTASCDACHANYSAFAPARMNHAGTTGPLAAGSCSTCHSGSYLAINAQVKSATHVATTAQCDTCHNSTTTWATATFVHDATAVGKCATCHNGATALGKPSTHIPTTAQCSTCHNNYTAFRPAAMSHAATTGPVASANCSLCHNGSYTAMNALAKPAIHIPTAVQCDTCHKGGYLTWSPATMDHSGQTACATCHSGTYLAQNAQTKPATHIATTAQCSTCHSSTTTWATGIFNHATANPPAAGICSSCHNGSNALGKPTTHIPTTAQCDTCHKNYTAFAPATMDHANASGPVAAANCATCHSGSYTFANAQAKSATHLVTTAQCDTCHKSTTVWTGASYAHAATAAGTCSTCHNGATALGKPAAHIPTTAQCDTCHTNYTAFKPARMNHTGLASQCATCHAGSYTAVNALAKPATHIPSGAQCDACHISGFTAFIPATMNHAGTTSPVAAGNCATCHSGAYVANNAQVKSATHIPTTAQCDSSGCHSSTTTWASATFNHTTATPAVAGRCSTCHNGTTALGKPGTHIPTTAQCDSCHLVFTAFAPASMRHSSTTGPVAAGNCATCHGGAYVTVNALAKTATHIPTTAQCDTCHNNTTAWKPVVYNHTGVVAGSCATCHNGVNALGKPVTHLPTTVSCNVCHTIATAFAPAKMNHSGPGVNVTNNCSTCHSGAYLAINAQVKSATHVATAAQCDSCHKSTISWATVTFAHDATAVGTCATCHNGATALGKPTTHIPSSAQCSTCHNNYTAFRPALMSHPGTTGPVATGNCSSCHNGSYTAVNALSKPTAHIPTTGQCDSCHKNGYVAWAPSTMNHTGLTSCSTCHSGAYSTQNAQFKPVTHIATTAQCSSCHNSTTTWATGTFNHATANPPATGICATCHNGTSALGKATGHIRTTAQCDTCHKNYTAFAPAVMSHTGTTGPVAAANCATCHNGSYTAVNAQAKTGTHILTSQSCDVCHTTAAWKPTSFAHTGVVAGSCTTCHNGISAVGKPTLHIPTTASCEVCHRTGLSWLPLITPYSHAGVAAGSCATCHIASFPSMEAKPASHLPTTAACDACHHSYVTWLPATYNHSGVAANTCATCHGGAYTGIMGKSSNHIPTTLTGLLGDECNYCHSSKTSFATEKMNHGSIQTSCKTCHGSPTPYAGSMQTIKVGSHQGSKAADDCSKSGCHKPLGSKGKPYSAWN